MWWLIIILLVAHVGVLPKPLPAAHVGALLKLLRKRRGLTVLALVIAMEACGYDLRMSTYLKLETGTFLLDDGQPFLDAYADALRLTQDEWEMLATQWAFGRLSRDLSPDLARQLLAPQLGTEPTP